MSEEAPEYSAAKPAPAGMRDLAQDEIDLMNEISDEGKRLLALCDKVDRHIAEDRQAAIAARDHARLGQMMIAQPEIWAAQGRKELKIALMLLKRAIGQPENF